MLGFNSPSETIIYLGCEGTCYQKMHPPKDKIYNERTIEFGLVIEHSIYQQLKVFFSFVIFCQRVCATVHGTLGTAEECI